MTTISIENTEHFSRKKFKDLADLQDFLLMKQLENEFSDEFIQEINSREEDLKSGKVKAISWEKVKSKLNK